MSITIPPQSCLRTPLHVPGVRRAWLSVRVGGGMRCEWGAELVWVVVDDSGLRDVRNGKPFWPVPLGVPIDLDEGRDPLFHSLHVIVVNTTDSPITTSMEVSSSLDSAYTPTPCSLGEAVDEPRPATILVYREPEPQPTPVEKLL